MSDPSAGDPLGMSDARVEPPPIDADVLFRALFETSPDAVGVSQHGTHKLVNAAYLRLFGYERADELLGGSILALIAPECHDQIVANIRARSSGQPVPGSYVTTGRRRDGSTFDMDVRPSSYLYGGLPYTLVVLRDITAELAAERALRESQAFYRALFDVNTAVKILLDPETGAFVDANRAACDFYGLSVAQLREMRIFDINTAPREVTAARLREAARGERSHYVFQHRLPSGDLRDVEVYTGPVDAHGRRLLLSILHDVTDRRRLETQLQHAQKLEAVGRLAGGIAHDFNNLLTVIDGYGELLLHDARPGSRSHDWADRLLQATRRAERLVAQLLAVGRRQLVQPRPIHLGQELTELEGLLRRVVGDHVQLVLAVDPALGWCHADPAQIEQVVLNLAVNARDAMPGGGRLTVAAAPRRVVAGEPGAPVGVGSGTYCALVVRDTGAGMDADTLAKAFDPFFTTKVNGTGLGLASVWGIVQQTGGHVLADSRPREGATFTVLIPTIQPPGEPLTAAPTPLRDAPSSTVLVVEDQLEVRQLLTTRLCALGHRVLEAGDGAAALAVAEGMPHLDLLITDVCMPGMTGPELVRHLTARWPGLRALVISGYADDLAHGVEALGPNVRFLAKPFSGVALRDAIACALGTR